MVIYNIKESLIYARAAFALILFFVFFCVVLICVHTEEQLEFLSSSKCVEVSSKY